MIFWFGDKNLMKSIVNGKTCIYNINNINLLNNDKQSNKNRMRHYN